MNILGKKLSLTDLIQIIILIISIIFVYYFGPIKTKIQTLLILSIFIFLPGYFHFIRSVEYEKLYRKSFRYFTWFEKIMFSLREGLFILTKSTYFSLLVSTCIITSLIILGILTNNFSMVITTLSDSNLFGELIIIFILTYSFVTMYYPIEKIFFRNSLLKGSDSTRIIIEVLMLMIFAYLSGFTFNLSEILSEIKNLAEILKF